MNVALRNKYEKAPQASPRAWKEKCDELENNNELVSHSKGKYESLKSQIMGWINERKHLNGILDIYDRTINLL